MSRALLVLLVGLPAAAQVRGPEEGWDMPSRNAAWARTPWSLTPSAGVGFGGMPMGFRAALEVAYAPPILERQLLLALETSYAQSSVEGPRVNLGPSFTVTARQLGLAALASFHWMPPRAPITPFFGGGAALYLRQPQTEFLDGSGRSERELAPAGIVFAGFQWLIAPGALETALRAEYSPSQTRVLGTSTPFPLSVSVGYRIPIRI